MFQLVAILALSLSFAACTQKTQMTSYPLLSGALASEYQQNETIAFKPAPGHHFNLEAPQACGQGKWLERTALFQRCQLSQSGSQVFLFSVCDDAKTFCEQVKHKANVKSAWNTTPTPHFPEQAKQAHQAAPGFLHNDPSATQTQATAKKQNILIDFYGIWCPPCNRLDETVFSKPEFQKYSANLAKLQLDADASISFAWKNHFKISGYPTLILANSNLEEIDRLVGYRPLQQVIDWMKRNEGRMPITTLLAMSRVMSPAERLRVAQYYYERREYSEAKAQLEFSQGTKAPLTAEMKLLLAQVNLELAKQQADKKITIAAYLKLLREHSNSIEFSSWAEALYGLSESDGKPFILPAISSLEKWRTRPQALQAEGYSLGDTWMMTAGLEDIRKNEAAQKAAYSQAAIAYKKETAESNLPLARGANLDLAEALRQSGDLAAAEKLYQELLAKYGKEFTFNYGFAYLLLETKRAEAALPLANAALENSYGDNFLRASELKAKIQIKLGDKKAAESTVLSALEKMDITKLTDVRTHAYIARLRNRLAEAQKK